MDFKITGLPQAHFVSLQVLDDEALRGKPLLVSAGLCPTVCTTHGTVRLPDPRDTPTPRLGVRADARLDGLHENFAVVQRSSGMALGSRFASQRTTVHAGTGAVVRSSASVAGQRARARTRARRPR